MAAVTSLDIPHLRNRISGEEWEARVDLAAAYRLVAHFGWTHLTLNHISVRVPGTTDQFLINPFGMLYEHITASSLIKIDVDGNILQDTPFEVNRAGFVIHGAIHMARHDLNCILHTHTIAGMAISALDDGILPLHQGALLFYNATGFHDFEGIAMGVEERERLIRDLGPHKVMVLRNHGLLAAGETVAEAFDLMYHLEKCCETQLAILQTNRPYKLIPKDICEHTARQFKGSARIANRAWPELLKTIDAIDPSFRT
jgi:ribulose-5-phosphate 4-epimerase/fuculose-1-phosphate aldolase